MQISSYGTCTSEGLIGMSLGLPPPDRCRAIADALEQAAAHEAVIMGKALSLGVGIGLSDNGIKTAIDDCRSRYDAIVEAHQIFLAQSSG